MKKERRVSRPMNRGGVALLVEALEVGGAGSWWGGRGWRPLGVGGGRAWVEVD